MKVPQEPGGKHGVADPGRGDEEDSHASARGLYKPPAALAKPRAAADHAGMAEKLYVTLADRALIAVAGPDARPFLQNLVSNDVDRVAPDRAIYAALLTPQGRYLFDFFIVEVGGVLHLDCEAARRDALLKRLSLYKLRAKIELRAADEFAVFAAFGGTPSGEANGHARDIDGGVLYVDPRDPAAGFRAVLRNAAPLEALGFCRAEFAAYDAMRLALGLPDSGRDLVADKALLLECNFEALNGVDFEKGCYVGQEVTTRMKRRALVKKSLLPVEIDGPAPEPGAKIERDGIEAGEMRSSADGLGMALLRHDLLDGELRAGAARIVPRRAP
jgi:folate-binding protein YgfZ